MSIDAQTAKRILNENPQMDRDTAELYQAVIEDRLPQYYLSQLREMRNLPDGLGTYDPSNNDRSKVRGRVIWGIALTLSAAVRNEIITDQDIIAMINSYRTRKWNFQGKPRGSPESLTTSDEIEVINRTLDAAVTSIEDRLKQKA